MQSSPGVAQWSTTGVMKRTSVEASTRAVAHQTTQRTCIVMRQHRPSIPYWGLYEVFPAHLERSQKRCTDHRAGQAVPFRQVEHLSIAISLPTPPHGG